MSGRKPNRPEDFQRDPLGSLWRLQLNKIYESARVDGREPPTAEAAVKQMLASYIQLEQALAEQRTIRGATIDSEEDLRWRRSVNLNKILRETYHYALDCWLETQDLGPRTGRPPLPKAYLSGVEALSMQKLAVVAARHLGLSVDTYRKQRKRALKRNTDKPTSK